MLSTQDLEFSYPGGAPMSFPNIECATGEHCLLLGQSGSGKTTLLHLMGGLLRPQKGTIQIADTDITNLSSTKLDHFRGRNIGIIFQRAHFVRSLSVMENLRLAQSLAGEKGSRKEALDLLESLGIAHKAYSPVQQLSVGEQQRVNIARAVINKPPVLLADEPTSALDDGNTKKVIELLEFQAKAVNASLLIVTHDKRLTDSFAKQFILS